MAVVLPVTQVTEVRLPQVPESNCMTGVAAFRLAPMLLTLIVGKEPVATKLYHISAEPALPQVPGTPAVAVIPFKLPPEMLQLAPTVNGVVIPVQRSAPCAKPFLASRKVVLQTMRTFRVRVRVKEVFMDRIIGFRGPGEPGPGIRILMVCTHKSSAYFNGGQSY